MILCHVCGKEKKPYTLIIKNEILSLLKYQQAREDGEICQRCDSYYAMTGEFKDATEEEFEIAKKAVWFANMMRNWWEQDEKLDADGDNKRDWGGTEFIAKWCREKLSKSSVPSTAQELKEHEKGCDCCKATQVGCELKSEISPPVASRLNERSASTQEPKEEEINGG